MKIELTTCAINRDSGLFWFVFDIDGDVIVQSKPTNGAERPGHRLLSRTGTDAVEAWRAGTEQVRMTDLKAQRIEAAERIDVRYVEEHG